MAVEIIVAILGLIGTVFSSFYAYKQREGKIKLKRELQTHIVRSSIVDRVLNLSHLNTIRKGVNQIFQETKADRFLILIAVNGKSDFNIVSVVFEQHNIKTDINAIARYRNVSIDDYYRKMLKDAERYGVVELDTHNMPIDSLLKNIYDIEDVKYSNVRHLIRESIDDHNDIVIFSSIATHKNEPFNFIEKTFFMTQYDSVIIPSLKKMIDDYETLVEIK